MDQVVMPRDASAAPPAPTPALHEPGHAPEPLTIRAAFEPVASTAAAEAYTRQLAHGHYENFSVISILLPSYLRQDFCNVYAFCRTADDLADEVGDRRRASAYLARFREDTRACYAGESRSAVFAALAGTIHKHRIPIEPFLDLIDAFEQDQRLDRYETFDQLLDYCRRSADPVGRLVLYMCGYRDERRQRLSDRTCSALQLANFWQDARRDLIDRNRIYLPSESMRRFGVSEAQLRDGARRGRADENFRRMLRFEVERTEAMFDEGEGLLPMLVPSVRRQIGLFGRGGRAILHAIRRQDYDTLARRPTLSRWQKGRLVATVLGAFLARALFGEYGAAEPPGAHA